MKYGLGITVQYGQNIASDMREAVLALTDRLMSAATKPGEQIRFDTLKIHTTPNLVYQGIDVVGELETKHVGISTRDMLHFYLDEKFKMREEERQRRIDENQKGESE